ncbi:MAG: histidine phosphatase family protein [Anaerolineaceae bacterium]
MTTSVLLVRHGQTHGNVEQTFCGHTDTELTPLGVAQARALGRRLKGQKIHAAYASDLSRARMTAQHALDEASPLPIQLDPGLREMHYGEWEGLKGEDLRESHKEMMREFFLCRAPAPGGESVAQIRERTAASVRRIAAAHIGQTVLVVSHGNAIAAMLAEMLHMPIESSWSFAVENTSLTRMQISKSGRLTLLGFNDASHIHGLAEAAG